MKRILFDNIQDFLKVKRKCIFCRNPLRPLLTNFEGLGKNSIPILNAPARDGKIIFNVTNTTAAYSIEAEGRIDIRTNALVFITNVYHLFPSAYTNFLITTTSREQLENMAKEKTAESKACEVFLGLKPYMQLYCSSKSCGKEYAISSEVLTTTKLPMKSKAFAWTINRFPIWMETFVLDNLWVQNDIGKNSTNIYSRNNPNAEAITIPLIDFESMNTDKLTNRIRTYVTFS